jgi:hypothetical protein
MTDDQAFERATSDWLEAGSDRTPPRVTNAVLLAIRTTPQERGLRIPWGTTPKSNPLRLAAVIAIVAVAGAAASNLLGHGPNVGVPGPSPTIQPTVGPSVPGVGPSVDPRDTTKWSTYVSDRFGFSIAHPAAWTETPSPIDPGHEVFQDAQGDVLVSAWSVAVESGTTAEAWVESYCPVGLPQCAVIGAPVPVTMDGHDGQLIRFPEDTQAFFLVDDRMYVVAVWNPNGDERLRPYGFGQVLLEALLSTMHLLPGGPAPSGTAAALS